MGGGDCGAEADGLGGVLVGECGGVVGAVDLLWARVSVGCKIRLEGRSEFGGTRDRVFCITASIALATRSEVMSPWVLRFAMSAALLEPDDSQAIMGVFLGL